ncbi:MAG: protein kinase [Intrasporangiaceae bacterium]|nr:protein kinase [Intrasporangiaceae bacterium]
MKRFHEGFVLGDRYRLEDFVASGGMGDVWKAVDDVLGRVVAVKIMRPDSSNEEVFAQRFKEEALLTAGLSHHNIATLFDYGVHENISYLVMEFVEGVPLSTSVRERGAFDHAGVRSIIGQMAQALHAAHEAGVVHRDVKPANVLLTEEGVVKLTDFGIARAAASSGLTKTGEMLGTPHYLSPEQALGRSATAASDLYALGVVAHELLTGRRPFDLDTPVATALAHITEPMPTLPSSVPTDLLEIIAKCLAKDPADRPDSAREIAAALGIPLVEVSIPQSSGQSGSSGEQRRAGPEAKLIDAMLPHRGRVLIAGVGDGRVARDLAGLGYRVIAVDPNEELLAEAAETSSSVGWVPAELDEISLDRIGENAPFDIAMWLDAPLDLLDEGMRVQILSRLSTCLGPHGRVVVSHSVTADGAYQGFRDAFLAVGLVPDLVLRSWDLRPQTVDATASITLLSRR